MGTGTKSGSGMTQQPTRSWGPLSPVPGQQSVVPGIMTEPVAPGNNAGATGGPSAPAPATRVATATSAHQMIVATGIVIVVVYLMVIFAGMSQGAGRAVLALFGMAILIQGLGHTAGVINFVNSKPLTPKG